MFHKILIANRGEIALRIMRACQALGIATVAVYSEADRDALHVRLADEAYLIGPAPASQSYLAVERILDAARRSAADAIHPGYGFLSERAALAEACAAAGVVFIGPPAAVIACMGNKSEAKRLAAAAGVSVLPGYQGAAQQAALLEEEAARLGFPLLIKAAAGGGGKGMRVVAEPAAFPEALAAARREALAAFGDDAVLLERLLQRPRHVEVQVLADSHGAAVYLGERECSIQRRHQKIIEEAPSPALDPALRAAMGAAAVRVARAAGYVNAGTVEFLLDEAQRFYFLEMNTRLQVEHPVTELVTGLDIVQLQIAIAAGEPLPLRQGDVRLHGHAIEARIYAEDPVSYLPATGRIARFVPPEGQGLRNEVGVEAGSVVGLAYDPLLAKLIAYGDDRAEALARLRDALDRYEIAGLTTNLPLLRAIAAHPAFAAGATTTAFLEEHPLDLTPAPPPLEVLAAAASYRLQRAGIAFVPNEELPPSPWQAGPWRQGRSALPFRFGYQGGEILVTASHEGRARWRLQAGDAELEVELGEPRPGVVLLHANGQRLRLEVADDAGALVVGWQSRSYRLDPPAPLVGGAGGTSEHSSHDLRAPMPGSIVRLLVREGDEVALNQPLLVLEAMKMEHPIAAPYAGRVTALHCAEGQTVAAGAALIDIAEAE